MKSRLLILVLWFTLPTYAKHIVGGSFSLKHLNGNQYELTLNVLRDCFGNGAEFDGLEVSIPCVVGIFDRADNSRVTVLDMGIPSVTNLELTGPNCASVPQACTQLGVYRKIIYFDPSIYTSTEGYYFSYQRCCRNEIIKNIVAPGDAAIAIYMEVPPFTTHNSTPYFTNNPFTYLCTNNLFTYNMNFIDPDGDSLYYSLVTPVNGPLSQNMVATSNPDPGPYTLTQWMPPYTDNAQIAGNPDLTINRATGEIQVSPDAEGVYVAAIKVEEFRSGKKLGEVHLELQFNITSCISNPTPIIAYKNDDGTWSSGSFEVKIPEKICFDINVSDPNDSLEISIGGTGLNDTSKANSPSVGWLTNKVFLNTSTRFCWQTSCEDSYTSDRIFHISAKDNGCPMPKTVFSTFRIRTIPIPLVNPSDLLCMTLVNDNETQVEFGDSTAMSPYFLKYKIYRSANDQPYVLYDSIPEQKGRSVFTDHQSINNKVANYSYYIRTVNLCGFEGPSSDTSSTNDNIKPTPEQQKLITVTVEENKRLKVIWPQTWEKDFARYFLFKTTRGDTNFKLIRDFNKIGDTVFTDQDVNVQEKSYCYYLVMKDTCNNYGPAGKMSCSILLKGKSIPFNSMLEWTPYTYWDKGTKNYIIYAADLVDPFTNKASLTPSLIKYTDENLNRKSGKFYYYVSAFEDINPETTYGNGVPLSCVYSQSNEIELIQSPLLHVPNAFSANGDGLNDSWGIRDVFVKDFDLQIFDRWGKLIYRSTDKNQDWNGVGNDGIIYPSDVYVYLVTYTGWDGSAYTKTGNVTILR